MPYEFDLIKRFLQHTKVARSDTILGSGDDCAIVKIPPGFVMAISVDTSVEGTHFLPDTDPYDIGYKSVAVSLSDSAAMGATPAWLTLALTLPRQNQAWLDRFADGVFELLNRYNIELIGGDLTRGPLSITTQIHALLPEGKALKRSGAKLGDDIYITGTLGDAGLALQLLKTQQAPDAFLQKRLNRPIPRIEIGQALLDIASATIDLSDGLIGDLGHILECSGVGAEVELDKIPMSGALQCHFGALSCHSRAGGNPVDLLRFALAAGDDYELCFTAPLKHRQAIQEISKQHQTPITCIGSITQQHGLTLLQANGQVFKPNWKGFEHF